LHKGNSENSLELNAN